MNLDEIKKEEVAILKQIDEICKINKLNYSLAGGTAIGAVRHSGFIPWDDDIDIMMLREDYNKLQEIMSKEKSNKIKLLTCKDKKFFPYPYLKVVSLRTTAKEIGIKKIDDYGVFIDIFPIDKLPENDKELKKYIKQLYRFKKIYLIKLYENQISTKKIKLIIKKILALLLKPINLMKLVIKFDKLLNKYNEKDGNKYALIFGLLDSKKTQCYSKEFFLNTKEIEFEKEKFLIVADYDRYLKERYGDYMKLPDENKRVTNHNWEYVKYKN